jgi:asparagine synthase (glutamine-hydrolysing)
MESMDIGDFLVVTSVDELPEWLAPRLREMHAPNSLESAAAGLHPLSSRALAASWGRVSVHRDDRTGVIGLLQTGRQIQGPALPDALSHLVAEEEGAPHASGGWLEGMNYALAVIDLASGRMAGVTDPFRRLPLYAAHGGDFSLVASDARLIVDLGLVPRELDITSLYHYLNFSYVPAPHCIFRGIHKLPAGTVTRFRNGTVGWERYWQPAFSEDHRGPLETLETEFRSMIFDTVRAYRPTLTNAWGTFLSGGTDSSSITGILASEPLHPPVNTFSIGFAEEGYDELAYARLAAARYGANAHWRKVSEADTLEVIPLLSRIFDEPYANASAIPTFYCAHEAAAQGIEVMVAGDGGDECFGGNERYAKNAVYQAYEYLPGLLRRTVAAALGPPGDAGGSLGNRIRNFARRGALANPERFYTDDSFASDCFEQLLDPAVRRGINPGSSLSIVRRIYSEAPARSDLHRLMYVDLMMAIADNDLTKVQRTTRHFGIATVYPYLDPRLVTFAGSLESKWKVNGLRKRYLFKRALRDLLPPEILHKKKQGFALPIADWIKREGPFRALLEDTLRSRRFLERGYFQAGFIDRLIRNHQRGAWDYSGELWRLLMLELWHQEVMDVG